MVVIANVTANLKHAAFFFLKTIRYFWIFPFINSQIFTTNLIIAFFRLYTDSQLSWPILKVELKSRTFQIQHGRGSYKI